MGSASFAEIQEEVKKDELEALAQLLKHNDIIKIINTEFKIPVKRLLNWQNLLSNYDKDKNEENKNMVLTYLKEKEHKNSKKEEKLIDINEDELELINNERYIKTEYVN